MPKIKRFEEDLIIAIITKAINGKNYRNIISYSIHEPIYGNKLLIDDICKNEIYYMIENIFARLNDSNIDIDSILYLANLNINPFNLSSEFYTDICYHFEYPIDKDITLKDRINLFYPNITLCEGNCHIKGINFTSFKAICECKFNEIINNEFFEDNILFQMEFGEIKELLSETNIEIIKCYKYFGELKYYKSCVGGFIILGLTIIEVIVVIIYSINSLYYIRKYILSLTGKYISYLFNLQKQNEILGPPKKKIKREKTNIAKYKMSKKNNLEKKNYIVYKQIILKKKIKNLRRLLRTINLFQN